METTDVNSSIIYIVAGPNGAGKTTFGRNFAKAKELRFINADEIALEINKDPKKVRIQAGKLFLKKVEECIKTKQSLILETTLSGNYLKKIIKNAHTEGCQVIIIYIFVENFETCIRRVENRVLKGGHFVPSEDIKRRFFKSPKLLYNEYRFLADLCYLINNTDDDFEEVAVFRGQEIETINEDVFKRFLEVVNEKN